MLILSTSLYFSNPDKEQYLDWITEEIKQESTFGIENFFTDLIGRPLISQATERNNYHLFSIYRTTSGSEETITLGIANNFFKLNKDYLTKLKSSG